VWCGRALAEAVDMAEEATAKEQETTLDTFLVVGDSHKCPLNNQVSVRSVVPTLTSNKHRGLSLNGRC
jgi:hypothetical protein